MEDGVTFLNFQIVDKPKYMAFLKNDVGDYTGIEIAGYAVVSRKYSEPIEVCSSIEHLVLSGDAEGFTTLQEELKIVRCTEKNKKDRYEFQSVEPIEFRDRLGDKYKGIWPLFEVS